MVVRFEPLSRQLRLHIILLAPSLPSSVSPKGNDQASDSPAPGRTTAWASTTTPRGLAARSPSQPVSPRRAACRNTPISRLGVVSEEKGFPLRIIQNGPHRIGLTHRPVLMPRPRQSNLVADMSQRISTGRDGLSEAAALAEGIVNNGYCAAPVVDICDDPSVSDVVLRIRDDLDVDGICVCVNCWAFYLGIVTFHELGINVEFFFMLHTAHGQESVSWLAFCPMTRLWLSVNSVYVALFSVIQRRL